MRIQIERWTLIVLLAISYLSRAPGLIRQGAIGLPALAAGFIIPAVLIALLLRSSSTAALFLAVLAGLGAVLVPLGQLVIMPAIAGVSRPPLSQVGISFAVSITVALGALDLWSSWRKAGGSPPPTRPSGPLG